ncbi:MAG TPA: hypothetical protein VHE09_15970 [Rhizomicrobium sp.]|nr:hypothetical protein [Rhizomicrobium sp.]
MLAVFAGTARADAPADLPLDQMTALLHEAGVNSAWSITQWHSAETAGSWGIEAYSAKHEPVPGLCATQYMQMGVEERAGKLVIVEKSKPATMYSFSGCQLSLGRKFYRI